MKKIMLIFLCFTLFTSTLTGCGAAKKANGIEIDKTSQQYINKALNIVNKEWKTAYSKISDKVKTDKTVEIINTRVINIKDNDIEEFRDVVAVVEFDILSDYYGSAPYYFNIQQYDTVVFYKDGSTKTVDLFKAYANKYFTWDFSDIIDNVIECGGMCNTNKIKAGKVSDEESDLIFSAIEALKAGWAEEYAQHDDGNVLNNDGSLKIINTQMATVNQNSTHQSFEKYFSDIQAIIEFEVYSDYYGSSPYYVNAGINNTVIVHTNGTLELASHYIKDIINVTYNSDFSQIFIAVKNLGDQFNESFNIFDDGIKPLDADYSNAAQ